MRLRVGPRPHHLSDLILGHLVLPQGDIVDKEASAELVSDASGDTSDGDSEEDARSHTP